MGYSDDVVYYEIRIKISALRDRQMGNILNIINSDEHFYNLDECKINMECLNGPIFNSEKKLYFENSKLLMKY